jgi:hypothetical protein
LVEAMLRRRAEGRFEQFLSQLSDGRTIAVTVQAGGRRGQSPPLKTSRHNNEAARPDRGAPSDLVWDFGWSGDLKVAVNLFGSSIQ